MIVVPKGSQESVRLFNPVNCARLRTIEFDRRWFGAESRRRCLFARLHIETLMSLIDAAVSSAHRNQVWDAELRR